MMPVKQGLYWSARTRTWHFEFRLGGVKHNGDTGHPTKPGARVFLEELRIALRRGEAGLPSEEAMPTLRETFQAWDRAQAGAVTDRHRVNMRAAILTHCSQELDWILSQFTTPAVEAIRTRYLGTKGRGYRTGQAWEAERAHTRGGANTLVKMLSSLLGWAARRGPLPAIPFKLPSLRAQETPMGVVWPEQVQAFLAEADRGGRTAKAKDPEKREPFVHSATAIRLQLGLGLREDEAVNARWEWLDTRRKVYRVGETKSRRLREVPLPGWLLEHLEHVRALQGGPKVGLILPAGKDKDGNPAPHAKTFTAKPVARVASKLEIHGLTPHRLRATFATAHFEAGTPLSQIQQMLGHKDPATTMGYIVQRPKDQAASQDRVAEAMGFPSSPPSVPDEKPKKRTTLSKKKT